MKKLFGRSQPRPEKGQYSTRPTPFTGNEERAPTPIHTQHASAPRDSAETSPVDAEKWQLVLEETLPNPHSPTPQSAQSTPSPNTLRKNSAPLPTNKPRPPLAADGPNKSSTAVGALGILRSLDPHNPPPMTVDPFPLTSDHGHGHTQHQPPPQQQQQQPQQQQQQQPQHQKKQGFWGRNEKDKEKEKKALQKAQARERELLREREAHHPEEGELTRMIGYLTATASEDWPLLLEVCERASQNESNAKEAVRALRREFRYGGPPGQLSAARLFALLLRNSSPVVISQTTSRKFLDTLEDLIQSPRTSPVVRERICDVVAAAAYASSGGGARGSDKDGFKGLWKKIRPPDKPEDGMPFNPDDAMFNPPMQAPPRSSYEPPPQKRPSYELQQPPYPLPVGVDDKRPRTNSNNMKQNGKPHGHSTRNRIIPPEEDMRRLFQECKIALGNANLLTSALAHSQPSDVGERNGIVKEFYVKCRTSQELIYAQIPWASANAEKSRVARDLEIAKNLSSGSPDPETAGKTQEENLLDALLQANAELVSVLKQHDDIERINTERQAEERSRRDATGRPINQNQRLYPNSGVSTRDPSPSPPSVHNQQYTPPNQTHMQPQPISPANSISTNNDSSPQIPSQQYNSSVGDIHLNQQQPYKPAGPRLQQPTAQARQHQHQQNTLNPPANEDEYIFVPPPGHGNYAALGSPVSQDHAPHRFGPRSRTPSPSYASSLRGSGVDQDLAVPLGMSDKARGKMKAVDSDAAPSGAGPTGSSAGGAAGEDYGDGTTGGLYSNSNATHSFESLPPEIANAGRGRDSSEFSDNESVTSGAADHWNVNGMKKKKEVFVYDAAAERTKERLRAMGLSEEHLSSHSSSKPGSAGGLKEGGVGGSAVTSNGIKMVNGVH